MRLQISLVHHLGFEPVLDDHVRLLKTGTDIALSPGHVNEEITRRVKLSRKSPVRQDRWMKQRRCRLHGHQRIEERLHRLIVNFNELNRPLGGFLALGGNPRYFFSQHLFP